MNATPQQQPTDLHVAQMVYNKAPYLFLHGPETFDTLPNPSLLANLMLDAADYCSQCRSILDSIIYQ